MREKEERGNSEVGLFMKCTFSEVGFDCYLLLTNVNSFQNSKN